MWPRTTIAILFCLSTSTIGLAAPNPKPGDLHGRFGHIYYLHMDPSGLPLGPGLPVDLTNNDVIRIFIDGRADEIKSLKVQVTGTFEGDNFAVQGASALDAVKLQDVSGTTVEPVDMGSYGPFAAPSVTIEVFNVKDDKATLLRSYKLKITQTYLASFGIGFAKSSIRFHDFEARVPSGGTQPVIVDASDDGGEIRPFVMVTFYSWRFWRKDAWLGRDPSKDPGFGGRINPFAGFGIKKPGEEYAAGASFTLARGLELSLGWHFARVDELTSGYGEGDVFDRPGEDVPTRARWEDAFLVGLSMDIRVATQVLTSLGK